MKLHGRTEVKQQMGQVGAFVGQLMQHCMGDEFNGQLDVAERRTKPDTGKRNGIRGNYMIRCCCFFSSSSSSSSTNKESRFKRSSNTRHTCSNTKTY